MGEPRYLQADCAFRHGGHTVRLTLARSALEVEVEAHLTADQWRGEFDAAFIEDLTHKTGNFKQFGIFCSMLESALMQSSESVSLELLTYADLETLRSRKVGAITRPPASATSPLSAKRYLILVYSVEFDRIHYPLPLPYAGRPDPATLRKLVRELRDELAQLRARHGEDRRDAEIRRLRDELQRALEEKQAAEAALRREPDGGTTTTTALRRAARRLEDELLREKARHQRERRQLTAELAEVKASERRLQLRVKSLTAELASCKRGHRTPVGTAPRSQERCSPLRAWPPRSTSRESRGGSQGHLPARSPSPAGPRPARFDPTAFVRARQPCSLPPFLLAAESFRSRRSAVSSGSEADERRTPGFPSSPGHPEPHPRHPLNRHPPTLENRYEEPSAELAEIDARLQALQEYMDSLDTRT
uniref:Centrosomal protein CCDC61 n=1 Tax=Accipiter nisus TaxID=211598 RepID=A0A8B9NE37_9AVES